MKKTGRITGVNRVLVLLLCVGIPLLKTTADRVAMHGALSATDFGLIYYGARCAMDRCDPYNPGAMLSEFAADGGSFGSSSSENARYSRIVVTTIMYPPTAMLVVAPLAMLRWPVALAVWLGTMAGLLVMAGFLAWDLADGAPAMAGWLTGFVLLNCILLMWFANPAGVVVPICVIAAWCFLKERFAPAAVAMLAIALVLKPHDAGFVWLFFLLAGGKGCKRALQTLGVVAVLAICGAIWIAPVSPHWIGELRGNVAALSAHGGLTDPGPDGLASRGTGPNISLQTAVSILKDDPHFYNPVSYTIGGVLILGWMIAVLRKRRTTEGALFSLAAISVLTLLPVYHRTTDAKLLLLTLPACAMLWAGGGARRWVALGLTSAAILVTSDFPLIFLQNATGKKAISTATLGGKLMLLALEPAPLVLLVTGCFYLWVYVSYKPPKEYGFGGESALAPAAVSAN